jgi:hypothetical protein
MDTSTAFTCPSCSPAVTFDQFRFLQQHVNRVHELYVERYPDDHGQLTRFRAVPLTPAIRQKLEERRQRDAHRKKEKYQLRETAIAKRGTRTKSSTSSTMTSITGSSSTPASSSTTVHGTTWWPSSMALTSTSVSLPSINTGGASKIRPHTITQEDDMPKHSPVSSTDDDDNFSPLILDNNDAWFDISFQLGQQAVNPASSFILPQSTASTSRTLDISARDCILPATGRPSYQVLVNLIVASPLPYRASQLLDIVTIYQDKFSSFELLFITALCAEINRELFIDVKNLWVGGKIDDSTGLSGWVPSRMAGKYEQCSGHFSPIDLHRIYGTDTTVPQDQSLIQEFQLGQIRGLARSILASGLTNYRPGNSILLTDLQQDLNIQDFVDTAIYLISESAKKLSFYLVDVWDTKAHEGYVTINKTRLCQLLQYSLTGSLP